MFETYNISDAGLSKLQKIYLLIWLETVLISFQQQYGEKKLQHRYLNSPVKTDLHLSDKNLNLLPVF